MNNQYLEILELAPGATKAEIKKAYRQLSKRYHPDVSKDESAREKFIEINEAYKFLTAVGPRPKTIHASAPAYAYDIGNRAYEDWRKRARDFARRRAQEAVRRQGVLMRSYLRGFDVLFLLIVLFNLVLVVDRHLPPNAFSDSDTGNKRILKKSTSHFDVLLVNDHTLYLKPGELEPVRKKGMYEQAVVYATPIFDKPLYLDFLIKGKNYRLAQYAGVHGFFEILTTVVLSIALIYKVLIRSLDAQLTISILLIFLIAFQLLIFFKY